LDDQGAAELARGLQDNDSLRTLILNGNCIGDAGALALGHALGTNGGLARLELRFNGLSDAAKLTLRDMWADSGRNLHSMQLWL